MLRSRSRSPHHPPPPTQLKPAAVCPHAVLVGETAAADGEAADEEAAAAASKKKKKAKKDMAGLFAALEGDEAAPAPDAQVRDTRPRAHALRAVPAGYSAIQRSVCVSSS